jgi:hypothetical protein
MALAPSSMSDPREHPRSTAMLIGTVVSVAGMIVFVLSAGTMVFLWVRLLFLSMGWLGLVVGICTAPLGVAYPFLHWLARGDFPLLILVIWAVGIVGLVVSTAWAAWGRHCIWHPLSPGHRQRRQEQNATLAVQEDGD